jgi:uncharacterized repeat protein (TIGR03833 family)
VRDVRVREHLSPGFRVKIVEKKNEATGLTTEGVLALVISKTDFDPDGIEVRLESGETGRVLRVWAPPLAAHREVLPSYNAEPAPLPEHKKYRIPEAELERGVRAALQGTKSGDLDRMIEHHEEGHSGKALRRFGIKSEELEKKTKEILADVTDEELDRLMRGEPPERR